MPVEERTTGEGVKARVGDSDVPFMLLFKELYLPNDQLGRPPGAVATARTDTSSTTYSGMVVQNADDSKSYPDN